MPATAIKTQKVVHQTKRVGEKPGRWEFGDEMAIDVVHLHPTKRTQTYIPIFPHGFYPKLSHTEYEIRQNVTSRLVTLPSLNELRAHGIDVDNAMVAVQVLLNPRHIKNRNFLRSEFPAMVKQMARKYNVALLLPASDMPSARLIRKEVLNLYRVMFSPLLLKGGHYTSGRMNFFFAAPPNATGRFKKSLNLESLEEDNLEEYNSWAVQQKRKRNYKQNISTAKGQKALIDAIANNLEDQLLPVIHGQLHLQKGSREEERIAEYIRDPKTAEDLLAFTNRGESQSKVKLWVTRTLLPRVSEIMKEEGNELFDRAFRFVLQAAASVVIMHLLGKAKTYTASEERSKSIRGLGKYIPEVTPRDVFTSIAGGGVSMAYKFGDKQKEAAAIKQRIYNIISESLLSYSSELGFDLSQMVDVRINSNDTVHPIKLKFDSVMFDDHMVIRGENMSDKRNMTRVNYIKSAVIRAISKIETRVNELYKTNHFTGNRDDDLDMMGLL